MIDLQDKSNCPTIEEIGEYKCNEKIEYSMCSLEKGWNVKFKKSGKSLCTIYPREGYFTILIVVGRKEKTLIEEMLPDCAVELLSLIHI